MVVQKLSALSSSLARVVSSIEEEEAQLDQFPVEGVGKPEKFNTFDAVFVRAASRECVQRRHKWHRSLTHVCDNFSIQVAVFVYAPLKPAEGPTIPRFWKECKYLLINCWQKAY